jgi:hypothetical protein
MWVKHRRMPQFIINDRDVKFTMNFWKHLFRKLSFNMTFYPQINDQT